MADHGAVEQEAKMRSSNIHHCPPEEDDLPDSATKSDERHSIPRSPSSRTKNGKPKVPIKAQRWVDPRKSSHPRLTLQKVFKKDLNKLTTLVVSDVSEYEKKLAWYRDQGLKVREIEAIRRAVKSEQNKAKEALRQLALQIPEYEETDEGIFGNNKVGDAVRRVQLTNFHAHIVRDVLEDDGDERHRIYEIVVRLGSTVSRVSVSATDYASMDWVDRELGARNRVMPGAGNRERTADAIKFLSTDIVETTRYSHIGWREIGGQQVYLNGNGAIGSNGLVPGIETSLQGSLRNYELPAPPPLEDVAKIVPLVLAFHEIAPQHITIPLLASLGRTLLGAPDFSVFLAGKTGTLKTALAAVIQQFFGAGMDRDHLPSNWSSTSNSIESLGHAAKDAILVVDDFAPGVSAHDMQRLNRDADRVFRGAGNRSGRGRLRSDGSPRPEKPFRSMVIATGEALPSGHSVRARLLALELTEGMVNKTALNDCQTAASEGMYAKFLSALLCWMAQDFTTLTTRFKADKATKISETKAGNGKHGRSVGMLADLVLGWELLLKFCLHTKGIDQDQFSQLMRDGEMAINQAIALQHSHHKDADPVEQYIELIKTALTSREAHLTNMKDGTPGEQALSVGWSRDSTATGPRAHGSRIGWLDGNSVYLDPGAALQVVQKLASSGGQGFPWELKTTSKRLAEAAKLKKTGKGRDRVVVQKTIGQRKYEVLHFDASVFGITPDSLTASTINPANVSKSIHSTSD